MKSTCTFAHLHIYNFPDFQQLLLTRCQNLYHFTLGFNRNKSNPNFKYKINGLRVRFRARSKLKLQQCTSVFECLIRGTLRCFLENTRSTPCRGGETGVLARVVYVWTRGNVSCKGGGQDIVEKSKQSFRWMHSSSHVPRRMCKRKCTNILATWNGGITAMVFIKEAIVWKFQWCNSMMWLYAKQLLRRLLIATT